jgi:hypothetical protein
VRQTRTPVLVGALAALTAVASLQGQQKAVLAKPNAESAESFTRISSIRELPSGKVLVADAQDKVVQLVDLGAGTMMKVGREGQGPGEYSIPATLLALPNGQTLLHDLLNRRFLVIDPDGKPGAIVEMPRPATGDANGLPVLAGGMFDVRGTDAQGRIYFQGPPFTAPNLPPLDSAAIMRWDRVHPKFDTVGFLKLPAGGAQATARGNNVQVRIGGGKVWTPTETWGVTGDGRVARVVPSPYRVIWMGGAGKAMPGPAQPYSPIKVTEADKSLFKENQRKNRPLTVTIGGPGGGRAGPPPANPQQQEPEFEETMPPFAGRASVVTTPDGEVWVLRTRSASDKTPIYDVFDRTGALAKRVTLNPESRVVGFGKGTVYVARTDEDDLQYLQRYARP